MIERSTDDTVQFVILYYNVVHSTTFDMVFIYQSGVNLSRCLFRQKHDNELSWWGVKCEIILETYLMQLIIWDVIIWYYGESVVYC